MGLYFRHNNQGRIFRNLRILLHITEMPAPPPSSYGYGQQQPSCFDKMKMGFMMGFCVGMASGGLFVGFGALRMGMRGKELMVQVGKSMVQGGGTFGTFMSIGTGIRC